MDACDPVLCHCAYLKVSEIQRLIDREAPQTVEALLSLTGSDQGCGSCHAELARMLFEKSRLLGAA